MSFAATARSTSRPRSSIGSYHDHAEVRRDVFELVRLVDHRVVTRRDDFAELALPHGGVRAQQMVVDDDEV